MVTNNILHKIKKNAVGLLFFLLSITSTKCFGGSLIIHGLHERMEFSIFHRNRFNNYKIPSSCPSLLHVANDDSYSPERSTDTTAATGSGSVTGNDGAAITAKVTKNTKSLLRKIDDFGLELKPRALRANKRALACQDRYVKFMFTTESCLLFSAFIGYRAYRGFFVILPAVFREVYRKLEAAVNDPFQKNGGDGNESNINVDPTTGKVRARTAVVVSLLSVLVTFSYVVTGAYRVLKMFVSTATRTSSVEPAFEAAADEIITVEGQVMNVAAKKEKLKPLNGEEQLRSSMG